jgi:predicted Na+-dependent transporter
VNKLAVIFNVLHYLNKWWEEPSKFVAYVVISTILAITISNFFPRTGSIIFLFLLTLALIPFIFHVATNVKSVKDITRWWKHVLILIIVTIIIYSAYAFISPCALKLNGKKWKGEA